jgi:hypothetical protein
MTGLVRNVALEREIFRRSNNGIKKWIPGGTLLQVHIRWVSGRKEIIANESVYQ